MLQLYGNQIKFAEKLLELETEGVVVANMTRLHQDLLKRKNYADMTGNNINHPNDYLARVYAQVLLKTMKDGDYKLPLEEEKPAEEKPASGCSSQNSGLYGLLIVSLIALFKFWKRLYNKIFLSSEINIYRRRK